jgi:hypothetical protein
MNRVISVNKAGIAAAIVLGGYHLVWVSLIAAGWAQRLIEFILWLHLIKPFVVVEAFAIDRAFGLVAFTSAIGYLAGASFAIGIACIVRPLSLAAL